MTYMPKTQPEQKTAPRLILKAAALTQPGEKRSMNQDVVFHRSDRTEAGLSVGLYIVCDGLGGCRAGETASRLTLETVTAELMDLFLDTRLARRQAPISSSRLEEWVRFAITLAHTRLRRYANTHWLEAGGLGSTITLALIYGQIAHIANVGDSRAYIAHADQITQVTRDHSMAARLVQSGLIAESDLVTDSRRNLLYRSLGSQEIVDVDLFQWKLAPNDKLLLCSDGLWTAFPDNLELARWLNRPGTPDDVCQRLLNEAIRRDGADDMSAVVVFVL